jgi:pimeloyl-ACP methyl ester carboxylesterase
MKKKFVMVDHKKVGISISGTNGQPFILLPGWTHDFQYETKFLEELAKKHKVVTISYPGYLDSEENYKAMSMAFLAKIVDSVIKHLKLMDFKLVGFSMGCQVVLKYIDIYNKDVKAILISPTTKSLKSTLNHYQKLLVQGKLLLKMVRLNSRLKLHLVNLAYCQIGNITEGENNQNYFKSKSVSINGAFDTLIALLTSFIDPLKYKENIEFIFGEKEVLQNGIKGHAEYKLIKDAGHGVFHTHYKEIAKLID